MHAIRRVGSKEREELIKQTQELLQSGLIWPSYSSWGAAAVFVPKSDGFLRMCVDYRNLNNQKLRTDIHFQELMICLTI